MKNYRLEFKYGLGMSVVFLLWLFVEYFTGIQTKYLDRSALSTNLSLIILLVGLSVGLKDKAELFYNSQPKFQQLFSSGTLMVLVTAILVYLFTWMYFKFFHPEWAELVTEETFKRSSVEMTDKKRQQFLAMYSPPSMGMLAFTRILLIGLVQNLVISGGLWWWFNKRKSA